MPRCGRVNRSRLLMVIVVAAMLPALWLSAPTASPPASAALPSPTPAPMRGAPTTGVTSAANVTGARPQSSFWDTPLRSSAVAFLDDQQAVLPGPDDEVRVIAQLRDDPLAVYLRRSFAAPRRLSSAEAAAARQYASALAARRQQFLAQIRQQGIAYRVNREYGYLLDGVALAIKMRDWKRLENHPQVKSVLPDYQVRATLHDSVPLIGAPQVWAMTDANGKPVTGQGVRVAIIDTGVDYAHPDLGGCFGPACRVIGGYDFVNQDTDPMDDNGHGTHVAGIVAASGVITGVAPGAKLLAYKVLNAEGTGKDSDVIAALERAADPDGNPATDDGAHVINLSLGGDGNPDDPVCQAVDNAVDLGIVVVAAAGNSGPYFETLASPGVARKALTVAASDKQDQLAGFSSRGPVRGLESVVKPDIAAPGVSISSTVPIAGPLGSAERYRPLSGTSMATPHIAGAAALLRQLHPTWAPALVQANLMNTAKDLGKVVYEQGAGRVQVAQAAAAPLVAVPGSLGFGIPLITGTTALRLSLINISTTPLTATASISTFLWADAALSPLATPTPVNYAQLSDNNFSIAPGATAVITVSLNLPNDAAEGYYTGQVILRGADYTLTVPLAFTMLSRVTVHILDENGVELPKPQPEDIHTSGLAYLVRMPNADVKRFSGLANPPPSIFHVPAGTYNIHAYARFWINDAILGFAQAQPKPLILSGSVTVGRNAIQDVYLNAATARHFTLNAADFAGDSLYLARWRTGWRYQNGGTEYTTGLSVDYMGYTDAQLHAPLAPSYDLFISDSLDHTGFALAGDAYGYSPRYRHFRDLNSAKWYEDARNAAGFDLTQNADQVYWFAWQYPKIDATTPTTLRYTRDQVSQSHIRYDTPGTIDLSWLPFGTNFGSGGDALFYLPTDAFALAPVVSAGIERDIFAQGAFAYRYWTDHIVNNRFVEKEFYARAWTKTYTTTLAPDVALINGWDLQPLPIQNDAFNFGVGPLYPAVTFDNTAETIRLVHPVFGSSRGNKASWGDTPRLTVYLEGTRVYTATLVESWWSPSPMRQIRASGAGNYRAIITSTNTARISYTNTIEAGFALPATDPNPPHVTSLEMPQRFTSGASLPVAFTVTDPESGVRSVEMRHSADGGVSWIPLALTQTGARYSTTINSGNVDSVSLAFTATDHAGNYLAFTTLGAAVREIPTTLNLTVTPAVIPLTSAPVTLTLTGTLRKNDGQYLAQSALPIRIYLNDQFAGYVRDVARRADGTFAPGTIGFDWTFIPTDFVTRAGATQLRFVFDLGTYARQERVVSLQVVSPGALRFYYFPFMPR